jgi:hypothetical protein
MIAGVFSFLFFLFLHIGVPSCYCLIIFCSFAFYFWAILVNRVCYSWSFYIPGWFYWNKLRGGYIICCTNLSDFSKFLSRVKTYMYLGPVWQRGRLVKFWWGMTYPWNIDFWKVLSVWQHILSSRFVIQKSTKVNKPTEIKKLLLFPVATISLQPNHIWLTWLIKR